MPKIRLLTSVAGDGPVTGETGEVITVDADTARAWADGVRAERVTGRDQTEQAAERPERPERGRRRTTATVTRPETR